MTKLVTDQKTGKPLPFAQQPKEFQIDESVKAVRGFMLCGLEMDYAIQFEAASKPSMTEADWAEVRASLLAGN